MRHCRICNRNYADDDSFCANDGSMLAMGAASEPGVPDHHQPGAPGSTLDKTPGSTEVPPVPPVPGSEGKDR